MNKVKLACIIDDDDIFRFIMKKHLTVQNIAEEIISFENGEEAINFFINNNDADLLPDLVFLDINMPVMDGWQFIEKFEKIHDDLKKEVVLFMVSSSVDDRDISRAKNTKVISEYLVKPLDNSTLKNIIQKIE